MTDSPRPDGPLWTRRAEVREVSFPSRTIELIVIPYDTETLVPWETRMVREKVRRGAFDGIERRANRIKVNRDHDEARTCGRAVTLWPSREEGLVAQVKISRTELGDETLTLADDGVLDASAGFLPMTGGLTWHGRSSYEITRAWLGHIAMVPEGAYPDARVLAVRAAAPAPAPVSRTPNLDEVRSWRLTDRVGSPGC